FSFQRPVSCLDVVHQEIQSMTLARILTFLATASFFWAHECRAADNPGKYNLIAIVTDDQSRWSVGAYGNKESITPNMDRLAKEGAKFINAFVPTPVCSPSRASYMTGRYGTQIGFTDWLAPNFPEQAKKGLPAEALTWPGVLQKNGYRTALIGKWHLGL